MENEKLFYKILENDGCIISEYKMDCEAESKNFPKRNRIISGLADAILVVEAEYKSGSVITGKLGLKQNKNVFCIPRNLDETKGNGTNNLIQNGAKLVMHPNDILNELGIERKDIKTQKCNKYNCKLNNQKNKLEKLITNLAQDNQNENFEMNKNYINLYNFITYIPINIEVLSKQCNMNINELNEQLTMLELEGFIKNLPGNNYVRM